MKHKLIVLLLAAFMLTGCSLAQEPPEVTTEDRLIGALVTTEYLDLFDMDAWLNDNIGTLTKGDHVIQGDTGQYQGRIYAQRNEDEGEPYVFPDTLKGSLYMSPTITEEGRDPYTCSIVTGGFSDTRCHIRSTDAGEALELSGTIYFDPFSMPMETVTDAETGESMEHICFHVNPVYQTAEGDVYVTSGMGHSFSVSQDIGMGYYNGSTTLSSKVTETINGKTTESENSIKVEFLGVKLAYDIIVIEMSADNRQLRAVGYTPEQLPREVPVGTDTAYVIVETHSITDGQETMNRQVCTVGAEDESFQVYVPAESGFAVKQSTKVIWDE